MGRDDLTTAGAEADAAALMDEWGVGHAGVNDGLVILIELDTSLQHGQVQLYGGSGYLDQYLSQAELQGIFDDQMVPLLKNGDFDSAVLVALGDALQAAIATPGASGEPPAPSPGPPFPDPVDQRAVYDYAGHLHARRPSPRPRRPSTPSRRGPAPRSSSTRSRSATTRSTSAETESRARALIDQWGIGRTGFNDGMVIFFDLDPTNEHGQVQLYAAPGFESAYLSNSERQAIFDNDMLP